MRCYEEDSDAFQAMQSITRDDPQHCALIMLCMYRQEIGPDATAMVQLCDSEKTVELVLIDPNYYEDETGLLQILSSLDNELKKTVPESDISRSEQVLGPDFGMPP